MNDDPVLELLGHLSTYASCSCDDWMSGKPCYKCTVPKAFAHYTRILAEKKQADAENAELRKENYKIKRFFLRLKDALYDGECLASLKEIVHSFCMKASFLLDEEDELEIENGRLRDALKDLLTQNVSQRIIDIILAVLEKE